MVLNRDDMLELTRRMTPSRSCFNRIAGGYRDKDGYDDGSFNIHFLKLSEREKENNLRLAKEIIFSNTNDKVRAFDFPTKIEKSNNIMKMLYAIKACELKNDALLETFYDIISENCVLETDYGIYFFHGTYDVLVKGKDKEWLEGSNTVFDFIICAVCPMKKDYEPTLPIWGFMYPCFSNRYTDYEHIVLYNENKDSACLKLNNVLGIEDK